MIATIIVVLIICLVVGRIVGAKKKPTKQEPEQNAFKQYGPGQHSVATAPKLQQASVEKRPVAHYKTPAACLPAIEADTFAAELNAIPCAEVTVADPPVARHMMENMREIKFTNITRKTNMQKLFPLVVLDTETSGLSPANDDIVELSAIKYDVGFKPISCFSCMLKPRRKISAEASAVNNITDDMVADCPPFQSVCDCFAEFISGCNIAGHNVLFDLKFLYAGGLSLPDTVKYYDTYKLARNTLIARRSRAYNHHTGKYEDITENGINVDDYKLVTLCDYYNIHRETAHRALSDCHATAKVFERLIADKTRPIEE